MRLHGYCYRCHKIKPVRVSTLPRGGVPIGLCQQCEEVKK